MVATIGSGWASASPWTMKVSNTLCTASIIPLIATCCSMRRRARGPAANSLRPALAHLVLPGEARARRVHADDLLVLGPHRHHAVEVAALERLVEGVLRVLRGGEDLAARAQVQLFRTCSTLISLMQRKCPSGHSRWKQGLHSMLQPEHARLVDSRRRVLRAGGAEQRHLRPAERRGDVHQARVVAHHRARRRRSARSPRRARSCRSGCARDAARLLGVAWPSRAPRPACPCARPARGSRASAWPARTRRRGRARRSVRRCRSVPARVGDLVRR